jgi:2-iminobutanoate/2-iminopropanoate deaminase
MPKHVPVLPGIQPSKSAYSQVVEANGFVFVAGQVGEDPATGEVVPGGIEAETRAMFANVERCLKAVKLGLDDVVKTTVYLVDIADWAAYNQVFREVFAADPPTRATVAVDGLVPPYRIEVEVVAAR